MSTAKESYANLVTVMRGLGPALSAATAVQYEAPPRSGPSKESVSESKGVRNPTLDIVLDPRRLAVSDEIAETASALRQARALLEPRITALQKAVARWEGHTEE